MGITETRSPQGDPENDTYLTSTEAGKILGRSGKTVSRWARQGRLPHLVTLGGHRRFPASAVKELARKLRAE